MRCRSKCRGTADRIQITTVEATNQQGDPVFSIEKQKQTFVKVIVSSTSTRSALVTINLFDNDLTSIGTGSVQSNLGRGDNEMIISFFIPADAVLGDAEIYANVFTDWPSKGGTPLVGEASNGVSIE